MSRKDKLSKTHQKWKKEKVKGPPKIHPIPHVGVKGLQPGVQDLPLGAPEIIAELQSYLY